LEYCRAWKVKMGESKELLELDLQQLEAAMAAAEADEELNLTDELEELTKEISELIEVVLERQNTQVVWARCSGYPWWPAELLSAEESRAMMLLTPQLFEDWKDGQVLVRFFDNGETRHQLSWARHDHLRGFNEVNKIECMPSKANKRRSIVLPAMEQASKRVSQLEGVASAGTGERTRAAEQQSVAAASEGTGRRRRTTSKPARFREPDQKPNGLMSKAKPAVKDKTQKMKNAEQWVAKRGLVPRKHIKRCVHTCRSARVRFGCLDVPPC
jgi:hypothetical protein